VGSDKFGVTSSWWDRSDTARGEYRNLHEIL
jgi:hypothetical protein